MLKDLRRLITFADFLYYAGDLLSKKSLRYTGLTALVSLLGYLFGRLPGVETYSAKVALALPVLVGTITFAGGLALKSIPMLLAARAMGIAEAQDLDLMEDYRKSRQERHLEWLWQRVFRFEWALGTAASRVRPHPEEAPPEICGGQGGMASPSSPCAPRDMPTLREGMPPGPLREGMPPGREGMPPGYDPKQQFLARARFALARPQPQPRQRYYLGIDLRFVEDWRNGGYFDRNDNKLIEQFDSSASIAEIKTEVGYGRWDALCDLPGKLYQRFWFFLITRAVGVQVGEAIVWLNRQHQTDYFNAQALLWPGEDRQPWVAQFRRASEDLRERRRELVGRVFGPSDESARRILQRVLRPTFWRAAKLRARYDPEYLDGSLGFDLLSDLEQLAVPTRRIEPYRDLAREVIAEKEALLSKLRQFRPELLTEGEGEALRAVRIAVHVGRERFAPIVCGDEHDPAARERFSASVLPVVDQAVRARARYSARLTALRVHHELTRLHCEEYFQLLEALRDST
jgi:hypothetical protein